jgi:hypothetical protein
MFKRPRHTLVQRILDAFDARFLSETCCYFGGGTRIVMELDEYRESLDIDLLCADKDGYRAIRSSISEDSLGQLLARPLTLAREVRADRYGIRTFFDCDGEKVKFEIVAEGRIDLFSQNLPQIVVPCLDRTSCFAEKLLANTDRWADRSVMSRDLIDLAFMASHWGAIPSEALVIAEKAYGVSILRSLQRAVLQLESDDSYRQHCIATMGITDTECLKDGLTVLAGTYQF